MSSKNTSETIFSPKACWIWDQSHAFGYNYYLEARKCFSLSPSTLKNISDSDQALLLITADALYQVWLNGVLIGHGPAKSAEGRRSVDTYEIGNGLKSGENVLEVLVLSVGTGTMTYCLGEAGLIFEIRLPNKMIFSDRSTLVRKSASHHQNTVRRWIMPCLEDIHAGANGKAWKPATIVKRDAQLYRRRVPLPTREPLLPKRLVMAQRVAVPNFSVSFRLRPYLAEEKDRLRNNVFNRNAYLVCEIISPVAQILRFTPTLGNVNWYFEGKKLFEGSGWALWSEKKFNPVIKLKKGANRLVGLHRFNHFEDINLAGFVQSPVKIKNPFGAGGFQVIPVDDADWFEGEKLGNFDWETLRPKMSRMDPVHTMLHGNSHDLVVGAAVMDEGEKLFTQAKSSFTSGHLDFPPSKSGEAVRYVLDLGVLQNGWLSFHAEGENGSTLIFSFFESLDEGSPVRIQWPTGCNNALTYRLREGQQSFESFLPYGVRYLMVTHSGRNPVRLTNLRVMTANCGSWPQGSFLCSDSVINGIYKISVQSIISGTDDTLTDCPTYEQVNWNCDNRWASECDYFTCANTEVLSNSIKLFTEDNAYRGLVRSQYPSAWDSHIPLWSFHWLMWCHDYYWHTGDRKLIAEIFPRIQAGIEEAISRLNSKGLLEWTNVWHFADWGHGRDDNHAIMGAEQAGLVGALAASEKIAWLLNRSALAQHWKQVRQKLISSINRHLWNPSKQAFADSLHEDGTQSNVSSQTTNAMMAIYGVGNPVWCKRLAKRIVDGDQKLLAYGSPFGMYYTLVLLDQMGDVETIFKLIKRRYGEMILAGDTTTWETFSDYGSPDKEFPTRSRCHPYAAYVVKYLVKYLLGVEVMAPGFASVRIKPNPPKEIAHLSGSIPTPHGLIRVTWKREGKKMILNTDLPRGISLI